MIGMGSTAGTDLLRCSGHEVHTATTVDMDIHKAWAGIHILAVNALRGCALGMDSGDLAVVKVNGGIGIKTIRGDSGYIINTVHRQRTFLFNYGVDNIPQSNCLISAICQPPLGKGAVESDG